MDTREDISEMCNIKLTNDKMIDILKKIGKELDIMAKDGNTDEYQIAKLQELVKQALEKSE